MVFAIIQQQRWVTAFQVDLTNVFLKNEKL